MGQGDHPKTFLLKALCCQAAPSWLKVGWWSVGGWPQAFYCHLLGLGYSLFPISQVPVPSPKSQSQLPVPIFSNLIWIWDYYSIMGLTLPTVSLVFHWNPVWRGVSSASFEMNSVICHESDSFYIDHGSGYVWPYLSRTKLLFYMVRGGPNNTRIVKLMTGKD